MPTEDTAVVAIDLPLIDLSLIPLIPETSPITQTIVQAIRRSTIIHAYEQLFSLITIAVHEKKNTNSRIQQIMETANIFFLLRSHLKT